MRSSVAVLMLLTATAFGQSADPQNTGYTANFRLDKPKVAWTFSLDGGDKGDAEANGRRRSIGFSEPCVLDGVVYVGDDKGVLRAFRSSDGKKLWEYAHGERIYNAPACDGTRVYVSTPKGIEAVRCKTGQPVWKKPVAGGGEIVIWPARDPGPGKVQTLYVGSSDGMMNAFIAATGSRRWRESMMFDVPDDPAGFDSNRARIGETKARPRGICTDGKIVFQGIFDQSRVVAMRGAGGDTLWSFATQGWVGAAPTVSGDQVFIGSQDRKVYCVNRESGEKIWEFATRSRVSSAPAVHKDAVFASSCDGGMYCLNRKTGEQIWKFLSEPDKTGRRFIYCDPVITDDTVYFAAGVGVVYAVNITDGSLRWKLRPLPDSQIYSRIETDGKRLFVTARPDWDSKGISALIAIGPDSESGAN